MLTENIDTTSSGGKLIFHIFGALAEFERGLIKERTLAGLMAAKEMGRVGGRPSSLSSDVAKSLLKNKQITVKELTKRLKADLSTLYRYLPGGRRVITED